VDCDKPAKKKFKAYPIGYFHIDIAEVQTALTAAAMLVATGTAFAASDNYGSNNVRIPIQTGRVFRFEGGHHSGMKPAGIPINNRPLSRD
jgi:hypothetical protein